MIHSTIYSRYLVGCYMNVLLHYIFTVYVSVSVTLFRWEQPAQACTPWVTVDGLNVQQWRDKWVIAATQLRQLSRNSTK